MAPTTFSSVGLEGREGCDFCFGQIFFFSLEFKAIFTPLRVSQNMIFLQSFCQHILFTLFICYIANGNALVGDIGATTCEVIT